MGGGRVRAIARARFCTYPVFDRLGGGNPAVECFGRFGVAVALGRVLCGRVRAALLGCRRSLGATVVVGGRADSDFGTRRHVAHNAAAPTESIVCNLLSKLRRAHSGGARARYRGELGFARVRITLTGAGRALRTPPYSFVVRARSGHSGRAGSGCELMNKDDGTVQLCTIVYLIPLLICILRKISK